MLDFKLFNIPVRVQPWFWLTALFVSGGISSNITNQEELLQVLVSIIIVFVSILVHEFGHALTSRKMTKVTPRVELVMMGGLAYPNTQPTRHQSFWITWMGPLAGLGLFVIGLIAMALIYGPDSTLNIASSILFPHVSLSLSSIYVIQNDSPLLIFYIFHTLLRINFWWSLMNLLPVFPLDGGQIYAAIERSPKKIFQVGFVTGAVTAVIGLVLFQKIFLAVLFGYLAYQNYERLKQFN